ncbi:MAG: hypothetical protein AB7O44_09795, partial [Hyphomicrobiaceae bacterium]
NSGPLSDLRNSGAPRSETSRDSISEQTIYTWRKRFGALQWDDVRRLKQLASSPPRRSDRDPPRAGSQPSARP